MKSNLAEITMLPAKSNYTEGRPGNIEGFVLHHAGGKGTAEGILFEFKKSSRGASCNYAIGYDGKIGSGVPEEHTSHCSNSFEADSRRITIECSNSESNNSTWPISKETIESLIDLMADISIRYNLGPLRKGKEVTWHSNYANTLCPGGLLDNIDYIIDRVNAKIWIYKNEPNEWAVDAIEWAVNNGILKGDDAGDLMLHTPATREDVIVFMYRMAHGESDTAAV